LTQKGGNRKLKQLIVFTNMHGPLGGKDFLGNGIHLIACFGGPLRLQQSEKSSREISAYGRLDLNGAYMENNGVWHGWMGVYRGEAIKSVHF
jgi:hypothetical protein